MVTWNQANLYILKITSQTPGRRKESARIEILFENLAVDPCYFEQCMRSVFENDKDVKEVVGGNKVVFLRSAALEPAEVQSYLEEKSKQLLDVLSKHKDWGLCDGPNKMAEHEDLE